MAATDADEPAGQGGTNVDRGRPGDFYDRAHAARSEARPTVAQVVGAGAFAGIGPPPGTTATVANGDWACAHGPVAPNDTTVNAAAAASGSAIDRRAPPSVGLGAFPDADKAGSGDAIGVPRLRPTPPIGPASGEAHLLTSPAPAVPEAVEGSGIASAVPRALDPRPALVGRPGHDAFHLEGAGVVLLAPFYPAWFAATGLVDPDHRFVGDRARARAAALIDHLATGDRDPPEPRLPLAKLLAGARVDAAHDPGPTLTDAEAAATEAMLATAIAAMPMVGHLSAGGLRGTWLARAGRLAVEHGGWVVRLERHAVDVLLARLPWRLDLVALPWMPDPVRVEW